MKSLHFIFLSIFYGYLSSCTEDFLTREPLGVISEKILENKEGLDGLLIGAYAQIDGQGSDNNGTWASAPSNWMYGSITSDDAYSGSDALDATPIFSLEKYTYTENIDYFNQRWLSLFDGVSRCNDVIRTGGKALKAGGITQTQFDQYEAEARFLRGHYFFNAKVIFGNLPYFDEKQSLNQTFTNVTSSGEFVDAWPYIEADFQFAIELLPEVRSQPGRCDKWAAKAYLAKCHMYQGDLNAAKPLLQDIIDNGPYELVGCYHDNYTISGNNNKESIWEYQASVNDGSYENGNYGDVLNFPYIFPVSCCGYHVPSQNLANAFQTDNQGLPLLDTFNDTDVLSDQGLDSSEPFIEYSGTLDPRLDWTVGRRGIPYLDWGDHPGEDWIRDQDWSGPYSPIKEVYYKAEEGIMTSRSGWTNGSTANNVRFIRLGHVILWRAEVAVEENDLTTALTLVNLLRTRARDGCWVLEGGIRDEGSHLNPAANYYIEPYPLFPDQDYAREAVRFETRLEFGMEGNRFFDLVRWGIADQVLDKYIDKEKNLRQYLFNAMFVKGKNEIFPIPKAQIDFAGEKNLKQNPGY